jgi:hypothetical protein
LRLGKTSRESLPVHGRALAEPMKDFSIQPATLTPAEYNSLLGFAQRAGAKVISMDVSWSSYEPNGPAPAGEWSNLDAFVNDAGHRGMKLRFQLVGFPDWARDRGDPSSAAAAWLAPSSPAELARWSQFVTRVVRNFGPKVTYYEIWNEENISTFWSAGPNPSQYANLLERSYLAIKAIDPSAEVMFGGLSRNDVGFLKRTYDAIDRQFPATAVRDDHFFDILGVHPYSDNRSPSAVKSNEVYHDAWGTMDENFLGIELLHNLMAAQGEGWKHLYIGEYGFSTAAWERPSAPSPTPPGPGTSRRPSPSSPGLGYVDGLCWYYTYSTPWNPSSWALLQGSYPNYRPTRTFEALVRVPNA